MQARSHAPEAADRHRESNGYHYDTPARPRGISQSSHPGPQLPPLTPMHHPLPPSSPNHYSRPSAAPSETPNVSTPSRITLRIALTHNSPLLALPTPCPCPIYYPTVAHPNLRRLHPQWQLLLHVVHRKYRANPSSPTSLLILRPFLMHTLRQPLQLLLPPLTIATSSVSAMETSPRLRRPFRRLPIPQALPG
jgi:hypothetical protein